MTAPDDEEELLDEPIAGAPPAPTAEPELDPDDAKTHLVERLRTALLALPSFFSFEYGVAGVNATDLFNLNTLLGASIEGEVVRTLNAQRSLWAGTDGTWDGYVFERQSQAFPDVRLMRRNPTGAPDIALGIELKGWFLLAKEGTPSFRFTTTAAACAPHDLLVVVPWYLDNVLSGKAVAAQPYVVSARLAAESRNYYWQWLRKVKDPTEDRTIAPPDGAHPYPTKNELISDVAAYDKGGNFGRVARSPGLMKPWIEATNETEVLGIRISDWYRFLRSHTDKADLDRLSAQLGTALRRKLEKSAKSQADDIATAVTALARLFTGEES
jgi:hypothetical protein